SVPFVTETLTNNGGGPLNISTIAIAGTDSADFTQTNNCPATLLFGASCTINVNTAPVTTGPLTATLTIADDGPASPQTVSLPGFGINPLATLSASSLDFGSQAVAIASSAQTLTLSNNGVDGLSISSVKTTANFAQT